jgi:hypothetical protein
MSNDKKPFLWAQGASANVREPMSSLRESGWHQGDIPLASNFNWLFNNIHKELFDLRSQIDGIQKEVQKVKDEAIFSEKAMVAQLEVQKEKVDVIAKTAKKAHTKSLDNEKKIELADNEAQQIRQKLKFMEKELQACANWISSQISSAI